MPSAIAASSSHCVQASSWATDAGDGMQVVDESQEEDREEEDADADCDGRYGLAGWRADDDDLPVRRCLASPLSIATVSSHLIVPGSSSVGGRRG